MHATLLLLALISIVTSALAAPATGTCTTVTRTATFDNLPTGRLNPTKNYDGLAYQGWEVVAAKDTVFTAHSSPNLLRLTHTSGTIKSAVSGQFYNDRGGPSSPSWYFGCQAGNAAQGCDFSKEYNVPDNTTYQGYFNSTKYPHTLEAAGGIESIFTTEVTWGLFTGEGGTPPRNLHLYIDSYRYTLSNCQT